MQKTTGKERVKLSLLPLFGLHSFHPYRLFLFEKNNQKTIAYTYHVVFNVTVIVRKDWIFPRFGTLHPVFHPKMKSRIFEIQNISYSMLTDTPSFRKRCFH